MNFLIFMYMSHNFRSELKSLEKVNKKLFQSLSLIRSLHSKKITLLKKIDSELYAKGNAVLETNPLIRDFNHILKKEQKIISLIESPFIDLVNKYEHIYSSLPKNILSNYFSYVFSGMQKNTFTYYFIKIRSILSVFHKHLIHIKERNKIEKKYIEIPSYVLFHKIDDYCNKDVSFINQYSSLFDDFKSASDKLSSVLNPKIQRRNGLKWITGITFANFYVLLNQANPDDSLSQDSPQLFVIGSAVIIFFIAANILGSLSQEVNDEIQEDDALKKGVTLLRKFKEL
jgi:hypothetical protein